MRDLQDQERSRTRLIGHPLHLIRRFFAVAAARSLTAAEVAWIEGIAPTTLRELFFAQPVADQRHGHDAARFVAERRPGRSDLVLAALLHDVGKRHAGLGPVGRSLATVAAALRIPIRGRYLAYTSHGASGAVELARAGAGAVVVDYARHHHGSPPPGFPEDDWLLLDEADRTR